MEMAYAAMRMETFGAVRGMACIAFHRKASCLEKYKSAQPPRTWHLAAVIAAGCLSARVQCSTRCIPTRGVRCGHDDSAPRRPECRGSRESPDVLCPRHRFYAAGENC